MIETILAARDIQVRHGRKLVLDIPRLDVARGETLTIIGPNGAGKSTLLRTLALLDRPTSGWIEMHGAPVWGRIPRGIRVPDPVALRRRFSVVFQEPLLLDCSVQENVAIGLRLRGYDRARTGSRVNEWLYRFGIAGLAQRSARDLSGGEAQRTALARALVIEPDVLFLDEPFGALDPPTRRLVLADMEKVLRSLDLTTVLVTHDLEEALRFGDRLAVLVDGQIRQIDRPRTVMDEPADSTVARFIEE